MSILGRINSNKLVVDQQQNTISINKSVLPVKINSITVNKDKLIVGLPKVDLVGKIDKIIDDETNKLGVASSPVNSAPKKTLKKSTPKSSKLSESERVGILRRASGQLGAAAGSAGSAGGRSIIGIAQGAVGKMIANPHYGYQRDLYAAKAIYDKLSDKEKQQLKRAVFSHVNTKDLMKAYVKKK